MSLCTCRTQCCQEVRSLPLQVSACATVRWSLWFTVRACPSFSTTPLLLRCFSRSENLTCWLQTFCLQTIGTHNQVFVPQQKKKGSAAGSSWYKPGGHFCIDDPFWRLHWPKVLLL